MIPSAQKMAMNQKTWFDDDKKIWHAKNDQDKVFMFYNSCIGSEQIKVYRSNKEVDFNLTCCVGFVHTYWQENNIKISKCEFLKGVNEQPHWESFKKYMICGIRMTGMDMEKQPFKIYWDRKYSTKKRQEIFKNIGLTLNRKDMTYKFKNSDINFVPKYSNTFPSKLSTTKDSKTVSYGVQDMDISD